MTITAEQIALHNILTDNWALLSEVGDCWDGFETVHQDEDPFANRYSVENIVITRGPSGAYYRWINDGGFLLHKPENSWTGWEGTLTVVNPEQHIVFEWVPQAA
jgi:hypothetical protein